jgi:hypothetical protein
MKKKMIQIYLQHYQTRYLPYQHVHERLKVMIELQDNKQQLYLPMISSNVFDLLMTKNEKSIINIQGKLNKNRKWDIQITSDIPKRSYKECNQMLNICCYLDADIPHLITSIVFSAINSHFY